MVTAAPTPCPASPVGALEALAQRLNRHGRPARVVTREIAGEPDVRLCVAAAGVRAVELLGRFGNCPEGECWQAVVITPKSRSVWEGHVGIANCLTC